jgi:hypothetical protein
MPVSAAPVVVRVVGPLKLMAAAAESPVTQMACNPLAVMEAAPVTVTFPPFVVCMNPQPALPILSVPNVRVPAVLAPPSCTPIFVALVQVVLPKLMLTVDCPRLIQSDVPSKLVDPRLTVPPIVPNRMPRPGPVPETLVNAELAANDPVDIVIAEPVPFNVTSGPAVLPAVRVPNKFPKSLAPVVFPTVRPRNVLF